MTKQLLSLPFAALCLTVLSYAVGANSKLIAGIPLIWLLITYCFTIHIVAFVPAVIFRSEMFNDLTAAFTYLSTLVLVMVHDDLKTKQEIAAGLIVIYSCRLCTYLFKRIRSKSCDNRFEPVKKNLSSFFFFWLFQALWTIVAPCPLLVLLTKNTKFSYSLPISSLQIIGLMIWLFGFIFQCRADDQKIDFNQKIYNKRKFLKFGLWAISRHPNYLGQIILWFGASIFAFSSLRDWENLALISPIFVYLVLAKVSGVPFKQKQAQQKWGQDENYLKYKRYTPLLFPYIDILKIQYQEI